MHDIIYLVALDKAKEECFGNVYKGQETFSLDSTRRLSIQSTGTKTSHESFSNSVTKYQSSATHLRAVYAFTSHVDIDMLRPVIAVELISYPGGPTARWDLVKRPDRGRPTVCG
jgi:disease resistance protein RPM1